METLTVDVGQETIHEQIRKLAESLCEQSGIKLERVSIDWVDMFGTKSMIYNIDITTSKR